MFSILHSLYSVLHSLYSVSSVLPAFKSHGHVQIIYYCWPAPVVSSRRRVRAISLHVLLDVFVFIMSCSSVISCCLPLVHPLSSLVPRRRAPHAITPSFFACMVLHPISYLLPLSASTISRFLVLPDIPLLSVPCFSHHSTASSRWCADEGGPTQCE